MPKMSRSVMASTIATTLMLIHASHLKADTSLEQPGSASSPTQAVVADPKFDINDYRVEGNTLLTSDEVLSLVAPFTGKSRNFGDVQQALEALQDAYQEKGYSSVRVNLPEQELEQGSVRLLVIEQKISTLQVEGNEHYTLENVLKAIPSLKEDTLPNMKDIGASLKVANQNPTKQTAVLFKDSEVTEDTIEATVKVIDEKPWKAFVTLDNTGNRESGHGRLGFGYQHFNAFDRDHRISAQYITTPHFPDNFFNSNREVRILALGYTIPLYSYGDSIDLVAVYSDTTSSTPTALSGILGDISGKGTVLGARYNHSLPKLKSYEHQVALSIDNRATRKVVSEINGVPTVLSTAITTTPVGLTYSGQWSLDDQQVSFGLSGYYNWTNFDKRGMNSDFDPYFAEDDFKKLNYNIDYVRALPMAWQLHAAFNGQATGDHLAPIEQFRIGGANSVRGFRESIVSGDKGYRWSLEFISPAFGKVIGEKVELRAVAFTDHGHISGNNDITGINNISTQSISSVGGGLRFNYAKSFTAKMDIGFAMNDDFDNGIGTREEGNGFGHISCAWIW